MIAATTDGDLPASIHRSSAHVQRTYRLALESAYELYGSTERAHRAAITAVRHSFEQVGDEWQLKDEPGHADRRARRRGGEGRRELYERARQLGVKGRSRMTKIELARAIDRLRDD